MRRFRLMTVMVPRRLTTKRSSCLPARYDLHRLVESPDRRKVQHRSARERCSPADSAEHDRDGRNSPTSAPPASSLIP